MSHAGLRQVEPDLEHGVFELEAVFAFFDGLRIGADHAHAVLGQRAGIPQRHGAIQRRLSAEGWEQCIRLFDHDDLFHHLGVDRLDVSPVSELRIGHDGGRIGVDEHHLIAFFTQSLTGLNAGVVELTTLADDDGAGADDEDAMDGGVFRHEGAWGEGLGAKRRESVGLGRFQDAGGEESERFAALGGPESAASCTVGAGCKGRAENGVK